MATAPSGDYRFGYNHDEMERLGVQHRVWTEDNRRLLARAGFGDGLHLVNHLDRAAMGRMHADPFETTDLRQRIEQLRQGLGHGRVRHAFKTSS